MNKISVIILPQVAVLPAGDSIQPDRLISCITRTTQKAVKTEEDVLGLLRGKSSPQLLKNLFEMTHGEPTRHANFTVCVIGASRSFLAQWTRHSVGIVFTSASQHFVNWAGVLDWVVPIEILEDCVRLNNLDPLVFYDHYQQKAAAGYRQLIDRGVHHSVARQVTTQAARNVLWFTANAQTIRDSLIRQRVCARNTSETLYVADLLRVKMAELYPDLFEDAGPDCLIRGRCTQKHLSCGAPWLADRKGYADRWGLLHRLHEYDVFKPVLGRLTGDE